jgi:hypothetical protein
MPFEERWPGVMEDAINASERRVRVIENCLNGRRTVWEDPFKPGRNGKEGLAQCIEMNSPLSLVILMLGTNDFQFCHPHNDAWAASQGIVTLVNEVRKAPIEPGCQSRRFWLCVHRRRKSPRELLRRNSGVHKSALQAWLKPMAWCAPGTHAHSLTQVA